MYSNMEYLSILPYENSVAEQKLEVRTDLLPIHVAIFIGNLAVEHYWLTANIMGPSIVLSLSSKTFRIMI